MRLSRAADITVEAYRAGLATLREGMTQGDPRNNITATYTALGVRGGVFVRQHRAAAFKAGRRAQRAGQLPGVMMCAVEVPAFMIQEPPCLGLSGRPVDCAVDPGIAIVTWI